MISVVGDIREVNVVGCVYYGCITFADKRVEGQCVYGFWTCKTKDFIRDKRKDVVWSICGEGVR